MMARQTKPEWPYLRNDASEQANGLVYWPVGCPGSRRLFDMSRRSLHATLTGLADPFTLTSGWVQGHQGGQCLALDGTNDYATVPSGLSSAIGNAITVSAWIRSPGSAFQGDGPIISDEYDSDSNVKFVLAGNLSAAGGSSDKLSCGYYSGGWHAVHQADAFASWGRWSHVAGSYNGATLKLYVHGVLNNSAAKATALPSSTSIWRIGQRWDTGNYFIGAIDDLRVYDRALNDSEIFNIAKNPWDLRWVPGRRSVWAMGGGAGPRIRRVICSGAA